MFRAAMAFLLVVVMAGLLCGQTSGPSSAPASLPASRPTTLAYTGPDLCKGVIDPYDDAAERTRFLKAAGVDNELDEQEFAADQKTADGFVRSFDKWKAILAFDKNSNSTIDWAEADAYRQDLRKKVLARYDVNADSKLTGAERDAANRFLAGNLMLASTQPTQPSWQDRANMTPEQRQAFLQEARARARQRMIEQFDKDGDGELSAEEESEANRTLRRRDPMASYFDDLKIKHFDDDGDGVLSEEEQAQAKQFEKGLQQLGENFKTRLMDADGDGVVSDKEQADFGMGMLGVMMQMRQKFEAITDLDGDGQVTAEERQVFAQRGQEGFKVYFDRLLTTADANGDGRVTGEERTALLKGIEGDWDARFKSHAADGKLTPQAAGNTFYDFVKELAGVTEEDETHGMEALKQPAAN